MHNLSWRITALVEVDVVLAVNPAKPKYDSFIQLISRFKGNYVRIVYAGDLTSMTSLLIMALIVLSPRYSSACLIGYFDEKLK